MFSTKPKLCTVLIFPKYAFFFSHRCERESGSLYDLGCLNGYQLVSGDSSRRCPENGTWTGHQLKCEGRMF